MMCVCVCVSAENVFKIKSINSINVNIILTNVHEGTKQIIIIAGH